MKHNIWLTASIFGLFFAVPATAATINTGETDGAYQSKLCPTIEKAAEDTSVKVKCTPSAGSTENIERVIKSASEFGLSQYDIYAQTIGADPVTPPLRLVRDDIGKECLFLVTKNKNFSTYGDIAASSPFLNFILPPEKSGHTATFKFLQAIDKTGLAKAGKITHAASTEDAITRALSSEDNVTLFVQSPDPKSKYFKIINANGGHFVPAITRDILSLELNGKKIYSAEETAVSNPKWHKSGQKVITACTPIILFTGHPENIIDESQKGAHAKTIAELQALPAQKFKPSEGWFSWFWTSSKTLSAKTVETMVDASEKARKASSPYLKKAKEASEPYVEKAKEKTKQAIEASKPLYEKAKEKTKQAIEAAKPELKEAADKAKELGKSALEKAGETLDNLKEKAKQQMNEESTESEPNQ